MIDTGPLEDGQSRFLRNATMESMIPELLLERCIIDFSYEHFYQGCATNVLYLYRRKTFRLVLRDPDHPECLRWLEQRPPTNPTLHRSIDSIRFDEVPLTQKITRQE